jgi:hypothetical protein
VSKILVPPNIAAMSIPVAVDQIAAELERFGHSAYVLTVRDDATPHVAHVTFALVDGVLRCPASRTAARNVADRPTMSVLWPPYESGGYSMIVDGEAHSDGDELVVVPTNGVLHRPAPAGGSAEDTDGAACASDCAPLGDAD